MMYMYANSFIWKLITICNHRGISFSNFSVILFSRFFFFRSVHLCVYADSLNHLLHWNEKYGRAHPFGMFKCSFYFFLLLCIWIGMNIYVKYSFYFSFEHFFLFSSSGDWIHSALLIYAFIIDAFIHMDDDFSELFSFLLFCVCYFVTPFHFNSTFTIHTHAMPFAIYNLLDDVAYKNKKWKKIHKIYSFAHLTFTNECEI